jgi:hypothetical protein
MAALATTAPEASVTTPEIAPVEVCALTILPGDMARASNTTVATLNIPRKIMMT